MTAIDWFGHFDEYEVLPDGEIVGHGNMLEDSIEVAPGEFKPSTHYIRLAKLPTTEYGVQRYFHQLVQELQNNHHYNLIEALKCKVPSYNSKRIGQSQNVLRALERLNTILLYEQGEVVSSRMTRSTYKNLILSNTWLRKMYVLMFDQDFIRAVKNIELSSELIFWAYMDKS